MKRCPQCNQTYTDGTLKFCRVDGTLLQVDGESSNTLILPAIQTGDASSAMLLQSEPAQAKETPSPIEAPGSTQTGKLKAASASKRHASGTVIVLSVLILSVTGLGLWLFKNRSLSGSTNPAPIESIAVLPFVNESDNAEMEYLSDGMTESLIRSLSQIPKLNVKARSSVFRYKGKETDLQRIAQELNVQAILNGRVAQRGEQLILNLELVDAKTENVIWSEQYNRKQSDLVSLQTEIARDVSSKLKAKLSGADEQRLAKNYTTNTEAYKLYLQGRYHWNKRTGEEIKKSIEYFNRAIEKDPTFALAYAGLSDAYSIAPNYALASPHEAYPKAKAAALKAIELDDALAEAHTALAHALISFDWNFAESGKEFQRAIELNPNYATARHWYGYTYLTALGQHDEAIAEMERARELDPFSLIINADLGETYLNARRYDKAIEQLQKTLEMEQNFYYAYNQIGIAYAMKGLFREAIAAHQKARRLNDDPRGLALLGRAYAVSGQRGEALKTLDQLKELAIHRHVSPTNFAIVYAGLGDKDQAFQWLAKSYQEREPVMIHLKVDPLFDNLRSDPRFRELLRKVGLPS